MAFFSWCPCRVTPQRLQRHQSRPSMSGWAFCVGPGLHSPNFLLHLSWGSSRLPLPKENIPWAVLLKTTENPVIPPHILKLCAETSPGLCKWSFFMCPLFCTVFTTKSESLKLYVLLISETGLQKKDILMQRIWTTVQKATGCTANHGFQMWIHFKPHDRKP